MAEEESIITLKIDDKKEEITIEKKKKSIFESLMFWQFSSVLFLILLIASLFAVFYDSGDIGKDQAREKIKEYVDTVLAGQIIDYSIGEAVEEESGLYKISLIINEQTIDSFITKDGAMFFPNGVDLERFFALGGTFDQGIAADEGVPPETAPIDENIEENSGLEE